MSAIAELTPQKETGRGRRSLSPSMRVNCRLCVKFGPQGDHTGTESSFQLSKQAGSFDVILAKLYVWKCWIANRILRAEDKSDWVCSSCGRKIRALHQLYPPNGELARRLKTASHGPTKWMSLSPLENSKQLWTYTVLVNKYIDLFRYTKKLPLSVRPLLLKFWARICHQKQVCLPHGILLAFKVSCPACGLLCWDLARFQPMVILGEDQCSLPRRRF